MEVVAKLPLSGHIARAKSGLIYLNVDDGYIHEVFPRLAHTGAQKPNYFDYDTDAIGAHISIFYPEENISLQDLDYGRIHTFQIENLVTTEVLNNRYYVLLCHAPSLAILRQRYGLRKKLSFRNYVIDFHMTIAVQTL